MVEISVITDFLTKWWFVIVVLFLVGVVFVVRMFRKKKAKKNEQMDFPHVPPIEERVQQQPVQHQPEPQVNVLNNSNLDNPFMNVFDDKEMESQQHELIEGIKSIGSIMDKDSGQVDTALEDEKELLRSELATVSDKLHKLEDYGKKMGDLFDKYKVRERYVVQRISVVEEMLRRNNA